MSTGKLETKETLAGKLVARGDDGVSPIVDVSTIEGGSRITITDVKGAKSFNVMDGPGAVVCTKYGHPFTANDSAASPLKGLVLYGKTGQKQPTPTPTDPAPLFSKGDTGSVTAHIDSLAMVTIETPGGMHGILMEAVCEKHTYTDAKGLKWFADTIDFAGGLHIQRCFTVAFDGSEPWYLGGTGLLMLSSNDYEPLESFDTGTSAPDNGYCAYHMCSHFRSLPRVGMLPDGTVNSYGSINGKTLQFNDSAYNGNLEGWKAWLAQQAAVGTPVTMVLGRINPVKTALSQDVLKQYQKMQTKYGGTTIGNTASADMAVTYVADTKLYIDNKFNELAAAIVNNL